MMGVISWSSVSAVPGALRRRTVVVSLVLLLLLSLASGSAVVAQAPGPASTDRLPRETVSRAAGELFGGLALTPDQRRAWSELSAEARSRRAAVLVRAGIAPDDTVPGRVVALPPEAAAELRSITAWHRGAVLDLLDEVQRSRWLAGEQRAVSLLQAALSAIRDTSSSSREGLEP